MADDGGNNDPIAKAVFKGGVKDVAIDWAQFGLNVIFNGEITKEIPGVKTAVAGYTVYTLIRDQLFQNKIETSIYEAPRLTPGDRDQFLRSFDDPAGRKKLFEAIFLYLDKLDNMEKPVMLKQVFAALVRGKINQDTFTRLANAIHSGFVDDLRAFASLTDTAALGASWKWKSDPRQQVYISLMQTGLTRVKNASGTVPITSVGYEVTELGKTFIECMSS